MRAWEWADFLVLLASGDFGQLHSSKRNVTVPSAKIDSIVVRVGFNVIIKGSSEQLKLDFKELIDSLLDTNKYLLLCLL